MRTIHSIAALILLAAAQPGSAEDVAPPASFKDCEQCPQMVTLPAGKFLMGASAKEVKLVKYVDSSLPQHEVGIAYPFGIGRYEVTVEEFDAYVKESGAQVGGACGIRLAESGKYALKFTGTLHPDSARDSESPLVVFVTDGSYAQPGLPVDARQPAVCVSRNEINGYLDWLGRKTGKHYRLVTEAEWEYAYRAGADTINFWGDSFKKTCDYANFGDRKSGYQAGMMAPCAESVRPVWTADAGSYKPNAWGLYDMPGNVQEMVADCFHDNYQGAPADGSPWSENGCLTFVTRGGDYELTQFNMRASDRLFVGHVTGDGNDDLIWPKEHSLDVRWNTVGFRVAVSLGDTAWDRH
jgi:formylglycine-generating enzyme required for sulfatase activity